VKFKKVMGGVEIPPLATLEVGKRGLFPQNLTPQNYSLWTRKAANYCWS